MDKLLKILISPLVEDYTKVDVEKKEDSNRTNYIVSVPKAEIAKVIGKEGKMVKAIKNLLKIRAFKEGVYVTLEIKEK